MFEFDIEARVTNPSKGKLTPRKIALTIPAKSKLEGIAELKKKLHKKGDVLYVLLDVQCFKINIRKERVAVSDDELYRLEKALTPFGLGTAPNLFKRKEVWEF
jgi:hypothetical protein